MDGSTIVYIDSDEEVVEGQIVGDAEELKLQEIPHIRMANYDEQNGQDEDKAMQGAVAALRNFKFQEDDVPFFFQQLEIKMKSNGVKKNFTKLEVLTTVLPMKVINAIKPLLRKQETEFPNNDAYLQAKREIVRKFGPSEASHFQRAMGRRLTDKPSTLANDLINDMCEHELDGCCCRKWIFGMWHKELPSAVKQAVAHHPFNKDTLQNVLTLADNVYESTRPAGAAVASVEHDEAFHSTWPSHAQGVAEEGEVAAIRGGARGRGGRGGRGRGRGDSRGGNRGGGTGRIFYTKDNPRWTTPRHPDLPPFHSCKRHWQWGKSCHKCEEPTKCPWRNYISPRDNN